MSGIVINILDVIVDLLLDFTRYTLQIVRFIISKIGAGIFYDVMASFRYVNDITRRLRTYVR